MIDNPRLDLLVARYGRSLVIGLVVLGVLSLAASGWAVANPHTETTTEPVDEETVETEVHTRAVVVSDGLWEAGTELEDSPVYVLNASPELTVQPRTTVPTDDASVRHDVAIRYEAVRDEDAFWERTEPVDRDAPDVEGGVATSEATIDVPAILAERDDLEDQVAGIASIRVTLVVTATYDAGAREDEVTVETPLEVTEQAYWLEDPTPSAAGEPQLVEVEHTEPRSAVLVGLLALLGALSLYAAWVFSRWSDVDEEAARRAVHERRYAEWISHGSIPMWLGEHHVALDTLEDVVDVAIDTNERVVHDRQRGLFAVVSDDVVYYYTDRGLWEETAWPDFDLDHEGPFDGAGAVPSEAGGAPGQAGPGSAGPSDGPPVATDDRTDLEYGGSPDDDAPSADLAGSADRVEPTDQTDRVDPIEPADHADGSADRPDEPADRVDADDGASWRP